MSFEAWMFLLGSAVGSFLNVVIFRVPRGLSIVHPPSRCPRCGHQLRWMDNVPILSYLWLCGRCRSCGGPISARYPCVEAATGLLFLLSGIRHAESLPLALGVGCFASTLLAASVIRWEHGFTPRSLLAALLLSGAGAVVLLHAPH